MSGFALTSNADPKIKEEYTMKQNIYIAALLAGMLALAGCGGGGSADPADSGPPVPTYLETLETTIEKATTLAAVNDVIAKADQEQLKAKEYSDLQEAANARKKKISDAEVMKEKAVIAAEETADGVDIALGVAERNPNILPEDHGGLKTAADDRKTAIQLAADKKRDSDSATAVTDAIAKINAATTLDEVTAAVNAANANTEILQSEKDKDADDAGSYQMAAADKRRMLSSASQLANLGTAGGKLTTGLGVATNAGDAVTQEQINDAKAALAALKTAIDNADAVAEELLEPFQDQHGNAGIDTLESRLSQVNALKAARSALLAAARIDADGIDDNGYFGSEQFDEDFQPTRTELDDIETKRLVLGNLLDNESGDVLDTGPYWNAQDQVRLWHIGQDQRLANAERTANQEAMKAQREMASKLHEALSAVFSPSGLDDGNIANEDFADDELNLGADNATNLKKTDVAVSALAGWAGAQYTTMADGEINREAHVYTKVSEAKPGNLFGTADTSLPLGNTANAKHEYRLVSLSASLKLAAFGISFGTEAPVDERVMIDSFTQTAGSKTYEEPEGSTAGYISETGSYHGVRGTFYCTADCTVNHRSKGMNLGTVRNWHFVPSNPSGRVTMGADAPLASYGWWLDKSAADGSWSVGVFDTGRTGLNAAINDLASGSATYRGGAAGKYALSSSTGGRNEAGHFTASVELIAKFGTADTISGTVSSFKDGEGADIDGDWSVALDGGTISNSSGAIAGSSTTWSVGDTDGTAAGSWSGTIWHEGAANGSNDDDGVPDIVTGTFNAHLGSDGRMAGAFGADHHTAP